MKSIYEAMVEAYGRDFQFDMVVEECSELIKAILKLRRAEWQRNRGGEIYVKGSVLKRQEELVGEWADLTIMLNQLRVMVPGKYEYALEDKLKRAAQMLQLDKGWMLGEDFDLC